MATLILCPVAHAHEQPRDSSIGSSVDGRAIKLTVVGDLHAARRVLVVGCIHGTERAGEVIVRRLRSASPPPGAALYLIRQANPDGCAAGTRGNARGVDLNRNANWHWRLLPRGTYYSGPRALSEPESRAIRRLVRSVRPNVSIWYHQHANLVNTSMGDLGPKRIYSKLTGVPLRNFGNRPGSITSWQSAAYPSSAPFVVELPAGRLSEQALRRHTAAVLALAAG
ncbi:MAG TPA: M14 family zinc carboxypeptidase [Baekduia sp.]|nr:M14 family zinc carboxypeptidase [Baekduia sp.]